MSISFLDGEILDSVQDGIILLVNGIGYKVIFKPKTSNVAPGQVLKLYCYEKVSPDSREIFGFETLIEKEIFEILIKVPNVGPRIAYSIVSSLSVNDLLTACSNGDAKLLSQVKGVGSKMAEKIAFELKNFLAKHLKLILSMDNTSLPSDNPESEAVAALVRLGLDKPSANLLVSSALQKLKSVDSIISTELLIQEALKLGSSFKTPGAKTNDKFN